ncbi:unnamed protein product [Symbiodinium necroappetens]|uniref:Uncharacterized protein n=1 Tax=Symbiodinium necroappetens TaxID=1628268 RepID=A0A812Y454_9DINO|nr:unnamed protein product [Symbiodinium necroappetens]
MLSHMRSSFLVLLLLFGSSWSETNQASSRMCSEKDSKSTKSVLLVQMAIAPLRSKMNSTARTEDENQSEHHELLSANVRSKESLVQEFSVRLATALGVTDIISLCVLALVFLLALYFVWGGSWNKLEENPYGELKNTGMRASREAKDKFNQWQAAQEHGSPVGAYSPSQASSDAFPTSPADGPRRQQMSCC